MALAGGRFMGTSVAPEPYEIERRKAVRFPIEQAVCYKIFRRRTIEFGLGRSVNISASGILFTAESVLTRGERAEVAVDWPIKLDNQHRLKLVVIGRVVRTEGKCAALSIERYEYRLQGTGPTTAGQ